MDIFVVGILRFVLIGTIPAIFYIYDIMRV